MWMAARRAFPKSSLAVLPAYCPPGRVDPPFGRQACQASFQAKGSGHSGLISISRCGQEVLERTACRLDPNTGGLVLRLEVGFPANGRTINARELEKIFLICSPGAWRTPCFTVF